jgi:hypothetical protein
MRQWIASAWILLISIPVLLVARFFHRRQAQFRGIGLFVPHATIRRAFGADGRARTAAAKSIGAIGREIGTKVKKTKPGLIRRPLVPPVRVALDDCHGSWAQLRELR